MKAICIHLLDECFIGIAKVESTPREAIKEFLRSEDHDDNDVYLEAEAANYNYFYIDPEVADKLNIKGDYSGIDSESYGRSNQMLKVCRAFEVKEE